MTIATVSHWMLFKVQQRAVSRKGNPSCGPKHFATMSRMFLVAISLVVGLATAAASGRKGNAYRNLYGYERIDLSLAEALAKFAAGGIKFLQEGEEYLARESKDTTPRFDEEFDFVVVGAGSAGATIASRLSEIKNVTLLLIEAGRSENLLMDIPLVVHYLQLLDDINWKYRTESSETHCRGMVDRRCNWPRGRVMGGSSVLNYMIATRGNPLDYDNWATMGNDGWSYHEVFQYFRKLENMGIPDLRDDRKNHNTEGPVHIDHPPYHTPLAEGFLQAGLELGYPIVDYNAKQDVGFSYIQATMKNGTRMSTNRAYLHLHSVRNRKNLVITRRSHVNKLLIDPKSKRAYGVEFTKGSATIRVRARKEVILCAGAIGSAQILMLSGVGPSRHLAEMKINVLQDAPVGENLMDHIAYGGLVFLIDQPVSIRLEDLTNPVKPYLTDFLVSKSGPLTIPGGCEALAFLDVDKPEDLEAYANVELLFIGGSVVSDQTFRLNFGISNEYWTKLFSNISGRHSWTIFPMLMRPKSRGRILLRNSDPRSKPKIFSNYLDDPEDVRVLIKGIRAAIQVSETRAMQRFKSLLHEIPVPGCEDYENNSDDYWECALRAFPFTIYHHSGTCKMAPETDPTGVVNPRLQVKGIKGLRVADASIMPMIITGHPNIPVIMIAEKLADMVKEDWGFDVKTKM